MRTGVSMGDGYGPIVVANQPMSLAELRGKRIGIPGRMTTAALVFRILAPEHEEVPVYFDQMQQAVREGRVDAGVIIHEGQLTYLAEGLHAVADLGVLWKDQTGLPLPLGLDVVRRDLGPEIARAATRALRASIEYARAHRGEAMEYALGYGRGLDLSLGGRFVDMYVNDWTLDMGEAGERALRVLLERGAEQGLVPPVSELVFV
jgi:1,4-dihydroxy-6-naphthoate synthase